MVVEKLKDEAKVLKVVCERVKLLEELVAMDKVKIMTEYMDIYFWADDLSF